ncbi:MAG: 50S ribosomal protein L15e [Candidatus Woesearchaeota archaeon]
MYQYVREAWKQPKENLGQEYKNRLIEWRQENTVTRIEKPTRIDRARSLGYKAKQGYVMLRVRVDRGGRKRPKTAGGRRPTTNSRRLDLAMSYQWVCEVRAQKSYETLEVLNSYYVGHDGMCYWYEVIMIDPQNPSIKADDRINWICESPNRGRVFRGLTSAGKEARGLRHRGKGAEHMRPSKNAYNKRKVAHQRKMKPLGMKKM